MGELWRRVAIYSLASLALSGIALFTCVTELYPGGLGGVLRVWPLVLGIGGLCAALCVGLGCMLFRSTKSRRELLADALLVMFVQLLVLGSGVVVLVQAAPIRLVWAIDHFELVSPMELHQGGRPYALLEQWSLAWGGLQLQQLVLPKDARLRQDLLFSEIAGQSLTSRQELHGPYQFQSVIRRAALISDVRSVEAKARLQEAIAAQSMCAEHEVAWVPLKSRRGFHTVLLSRNDGRICDVVDIDLWDM